MPRVAPQQLELEMIRLEPPTQPIRESRRRREQSGTPAGRLALSPDEASAVLGVSRDYFDEHVLDELRVVRRGRRILVALAELERWLDRSATPARLGRA
jgi:excisionase family DNA binding protein